MSEKKDSLAGKKPCLDLRYKSSDDPHDPNAKRFDFFLVDTGWNRPISEMVRSHLPLIYEYQKQDSLYLLTHRQSVEILKHDPDLIGHDPTILFYDRYGCGNYCGFRLNLGLIKKPEQALARLQEFLRFVAMNRETAHLEACVRRELYREGVDGLIKILRETSTELI